MATRLANVSLNENFWLEGAFSYAGRLRILD
jgi:hypothetical protein